MLIPIGHDQGVRRIPYVTIAIIAVCTLVQAYATFLAPGAKELIANPDRLAELPILRWGYETGSGLDANLVFAAFVHDGWLHLIGNMLFLFLAGSAVEDRWGHVPFAGFYIAGAAASTYAFAALHDGDPTILVGASGAVSATMGAFLVHFAKTRIQFWWYFGFRSGTFDAPAWVALPMWLADQLLWAYLSAAHDVVTGIAYAAHIGGFAFGAVAALGFARVFPRRSDDDEEIVVAAPAVVQPMDRYKQLVAAVEARDLATVRTLASRTILDLARGSEHPRIVELYKSMTATFERVPLTDGAYVAAATAADTVGDDATFIQIAATVIAEHPGSNQIPKLMWRLAEHRRNAGNLDAAIELLRTLASRFPRDTFGQRARQALDSRGLG